MVPPVCDDRPPRKSSTVTTVGSPAPTAHGIAGLAAWVGGYPNAMGRTVPEKSGSSLDSRSLAQLVCLAPSVVLLVLGAALSQREGADSPFGLAVFALLWVPFGLLLSLPLEQWIERRRRR